MNRISTVLCERFGRNSITTSTRAGLLFVALATLSDAPSAAVAPLRFAGPTSSQPLALTADDGFLVVANPDNNSVTFFDVRGDRNRRIAEVPVQKEPSSVAILPGGNKTYVANTASGTVSVITANLANGAISRTLKHIIVDTEPYAVVLTPNGSKLYVANARSHSLTVIDTQTDQVVRRVFNVGVEPRGLAISNDGDDDDLDETVYVTQFLALPIPGRADGRDDAKRAFVTKVSTATDAVIGSIALDPLADTGFKALGDALARVAPGDANDPANFKFQTGAYPNQLNNLALHGDFI